MSLENILNNLGKSEITYHSVSTESEEETDRRLDRVFDMLFEGVLKN